MNGLLEEIRRLRDQNRAVRSDDPAIKALVAQIDEALATGKLTQVEQLQGELQARQLGLADEREKQAKQEIARARSLRRDAGWTALGRGDLAIRLGKLPDAYRRFGEAMEIFQSLAKADPSNTEWQREVSLGLERIGDVLLGQGKLGDARGYYELSLPIARNLVRRNPGSAPLREELAMTLRELARMDPEQRKVYVKEALDNLDHAMKMAASSSRIDRLRDSLQALAKE